MIIILPPRLISGSLSSLSTVLSLNGLSGYLLLAAGDGLNLSAESNTLTLSVIPNHFVLRAGDAMTGNLQFFPTGGAYGIRLGNFPTSSLPSSADPGALVWDTTASLVKIWASGAWQAIGQLGSLTIGTADARYLKLDGTNGPMSGYLSMGSSVFGLGNLASDPGGASAGDSYFNSISGRARLYNGSSWNDLAGGVSTIIAGTGLTGGTITTSGTIAVNLAYNFVWSGSQTFTQPITFASSQTFNVGGLTISGQSEGDILYYTSSAWHRLPIGASGDVLTVGGGGDPEWDVPNSGVLGSPTTGNYLSGFFALYPSTKTSDAVQLINNLLGVLAPPKPDSLTGNSLITSSTPTNIISANLSAGLSAVGNWYMGGKVAGNTINTYFTSGSYVLSSPAPPNSFYIGSGNTPATYGTLTHKRYNSTYPSGQVVTTVNLTSNTTGVTGTIDVLSFSPYPSATEPLWESASAEIIYTQSTDGYEGQRFSHTTSGDSNLSEWWLDTYTASNLNPTFSTNPTMSEISPATRWMSGVIYYDSGSSFATSFVAATGIFNRCYNSNQCGMVYGNGVTNCNFSPAYIPQYDQVWNVTAGGDGTYNFTLNNSNQVNFNYYLTVAIFKAHGVTPGGSGTATHTSAILRPIDTYPTNLSTPTYEAFHDEVYRLVIGSNTAFTSSAPLANGNAQVRAGVLQYPSATDFVNNPSPYNSSPTFTGAQEYQRMFTKASASNGTLTFTGINYNNISPYGTGDLNVLLYLPYDASGNANDCYYDLGVTYGSNTNNGLTRSAAIPGRAAGSSGGGVKWTLGTNTTGVSGTFNGGQFRLIIIFNNTNQTITSVVSS